MSLLLKKLLKLMMFRIEPDLVEKFKYPLDTRSNCVCFNIPIIVLNSDKVRNCKVHVS